MQWVPVKHEHRLSTFARVCGLMGISRSLFAYQAKRPDDMELKEKLCAFAAKKRRYGYRRLMCCCFGKE